MNTMVFINLTSEGRQQHGGFINNNQMNVTHAFSSFVFQDSVFLLQKLAVAFHAVMRRALDNITTEQEVPHTIDLTWT